MHAGPPDAEHRIRRIPDRGRLRHPRRLREIPAVEQESQQFRPFVPARLAERRKQQVATTPAQPAFLVAHKEALPLGSEGGIRILGQQLAEPEPGDRVLRRFRDGPAEPMDGFLPPSEEREGAAELTRRSRGRARRLEGGFEERQGFRVVVLFDSQPPAFENHRGRLTGGGRTKDAARLRQEPRRAELRRQLHPRLAGKRLVVLQQCGHGRPSLAVAAQHGEQPRAEGQVVRFGARGLESVHRCRVIQKPHVRLGAKAERHRVRPGRSRSVQDRENGREVLLPEPLAHLGQQARIRLPRHPPNQQSEYERRHGRRSATVSVRASR